MPEYDLDQEWNELYEYITSKWKIGAQASGVPPTLCRATAWQAGVRKKAYKLKPVEDPVWSEAAAGNTETLVIVIWLEFVICYLEFFVTLALPLATHLQR